MKSSVYLTVQSVDPLDLRATGFGNLDWRTLARGAHAATNTLMISSRMPWLPNGLTSGRRLNTSSLRRLWTTS